MAFSLKKISWKWKLGAFAVVMTPAVISDFMYKKENLLELAHSKVGWAVECSLVKVNGDTWARCPWENKENPKTIWKLEEQGDSYRWQAGNGKAMQILDRLDRLHADEKRVLPEMIYTPGAVISLPREVVQL